MANNPQHLKRLRHEFFPFFNQFTADLHEYVGLIPLALPDRQSALFEDPPVILHGSIDNRIVTRTRLCFASDCGLAAQDDPARFERQDVAKHGANVRIRGTPFLQSLVERATTLDRNYAREKR
ncbi:MAG: hypothetical protein BMS9Abin08_1360 [Gammaproteobacteria bacterium]|nr:MAG: hypothetical protein BMS9Abin08_1360 [Gammaproteobacteria bacterium]